MPSIATNDIVSHTKFTYKLDDYLLDMLVLHGRAWFNWRGIGGGSAWYNSAVKHGYLEPYDEQRGRYRLTDKAMEYIKQLGEDNEITQNNQRLHTSEAQGHTPTKSSTSPVASWMA